MIYKIKQYQEVVVDRIELAYEIKIKGKTAEYPSIICTTAESLLAALYDCHKYDKEAVIEFPEVPSDWSVMEAVKKAYANGWFELYPLKPPSLVTIPDVVFIPND